MKSKRQKQAMAMRALQLENAEAAENPPYPDDSDDDVVEYHESSGINALENHHDLGEADAAAAGLNPEDYVVHNRKKKKKLTSIHWNNFDEIFLNGIKYGQCKSCLKRINVSKGLGGLSTHERSCDRSRLRSLHESASIVTLSKDQAEICRTFFEDFTREERAELCNVCLRAGVHCLGGSHVRRVEEG